MDNNPFDDLRDPFERLEEIEVGLMDHANHIHRLIDRVKEQGEILETMASNMQQMAKMNLHLYEQGLKFKTKIEKLERENANKK